MPSGMATALQQAGVAIGMVVVHQAGVVHGITMVPGITIAEMEVQELCLEKNDGVTLHT